MCLHNMLSFWMLLERLSFLNRTCCWGGTFDPSRATPTCDIVTRLSIVETVFVYLIISTCALIFVFVSVMICFGGRMSSGFSDSVFGSMFGLFCLLFFVAFTLGVASAFI